MSAKRRRGWRGGGLANAISDVMRPDRARGHGEEVVYTPDPLDERDITPPNAEPHTVKRLPGVEEVKRNTVEALIFRALSTPLAAGLTILQARVLGADGVGTYALAVLTVILFSRLLSDLGNAATREIGDTEDRIGPVTALALRLALVFAPLGIVGAVVMMRFPELLGSKGNVSFELAILAAVALAPTTIRQTMSGILVGLSRVRLWSYLQIAPQILAFIGFFVFVGVNGQFTLPVVDEQVAIRIQIFELGVEGAILAWTLGHTITAAIALIVTRRLWLPHLTARLPRGTASRLIRLALAMGAVNVIVYVNYRIEFLFLEREGTGDVGNYRTATTVAEMLWIITTAIATASWATVLHEREARAASTVLRSSLKGLLYVGGAALALGLVAPTVLPKIYGEDFEPAVSAVHWLLPGILAYGPVSVLSIYVSVRHRRPQLALVGPVLSIIVTIGLAYWLIPARGIDGAAMASSAGYIVSAFFAWIMFIKLAGLNWRFRKVAPASA
jgi:O-antigen/teichoic acid export membrane protein